MTGRTTLLYATLVKEYHLTLPEIRDLTPRQIQEIYFYPRDEQGALKPPVMPTGGDKLATYYRLLALLEASNKNHPRLPELRRRIMELENGNSGGPTPGNNQ